MIKTPFLAVDGIIKLYDENEHFQGIVLIERLNTREKIEEDEAKEKLYNNLGE